MSRRVVWALVVKDFREVRQNRAAWVPAVLVPLLFILLLPVAVVLLPGGFGLSVGPLVTAQGPLGMARERLPAELATELAGLDQQQAWAVLMIGYVLAPLLLVPPLTVASIVGADSFVGEKERKTLEGLLYTPATDGELIVAKSLVSVAPAVILAWASFAIYGVVANLASWHLMGRLWFPTAAWWPLMLWLTPAVAALATLVTVLLSARVSTFMEAYELAGSLVVIIVGLIAGQVTGVLYLSTVTVLGIGALIWAVDAALMWLGVRTFARTELIARL